MSKETLRRRASGGLLDLAGKVGSLLSWLFGNAQYADELMELAKLAAEFNAVADSWGTTAGLKARLVILSRAVAIAATITETTVDDELAAQLDKFIQNDALVEFLASILAKFETPEEALLALQSGKEGDALREAAIEKQIDITKIWEAIQLIIQVITMLKGLLGGGGTTEPAKTGGGGAFPKF